MENALAPAIDMLLIILTFFVKVGLLRTVLRLVAKHEADTGFFKAVFVTGMITGLYGALSFVLRDPLGPVALAATFATAFLLVRVFCWLTSARALRVALLFSALCIGVSFGTTRVADWVSPTRVTFLEAVADAQETLSNMRVAEGSPVDWEWLFARAMEGIAQLTRPGEVDRLNQDMARGMDVYRERKQAIADLATLPVAEGQPAALEALATLATGEVSDAMFDSVMLSDLGGGATSAPPQDMATSLAQIKANLSDESNTAALASLIATGSGGAAELVKDAAQFEATHTNAVDSAALVMGAAAAVAEQMGRPPSLGGTNVAGLVTMAGQVGQLVGQPGRPEGDTPTGTVSREALQPTRPVIIDAAELGGRLIPESVLDAGSGMERHPSYELLKVDGVMSGANGRKMILCNGGIVSAGSIVTVDLNGTNFSWRLVEIRDGAAVWRRLARVDPSSAATW